MRLITEGSKQSSMRLMIRLTIEFLLNDETFHEEVQELFGYEFPDS